MLSDDALFEKDGLSPCRLDLKSDVIKNRETLNSRLITFMEGEAVNGWLAMQSQVLILRWGLLHVAKSNGDYEELDPIRLGELGYLVNGELSNGHQSLQVFWTGEGWKLVSLSEGGDKPCWRDEVTHLGDGRTDQPVTFFNARYYRYWRKDNGMRPFAARLMDFEEVTP